MTPTTLPAPVQGYIAAGNAFDADALIACFAGDALVNDARREFRGAGAIRRWLDREVIGDKVTMEVTAVAERHGDVAVDAVMDGDYDKTGLPDPLVLTHYFTVRNDRIVRLIIIRNEPTPAWAEE
jgi:SnoaL-like domain